MSRALRESNAMPSSQAKEDGNDPLTPILKQIYPSEVTREKNFSQRSRIIKSILEDFKIRCIQISPIFATLFSRYFPTGSAYENLQVKDPVEFDIDIVLKLPVKKTDRICLKQSTNPLSFCSLQVVKGSSDWFPLLKECGFFDENNYLIGKKVLSWLQSLIDKVLMSPSFKLPDGVTEITKSKSGPALTLKLRFGDQWLSVDLVPVFLVNFVTRLKYVERIDGVKSEYMSSYFLVPKPLKDVGLYSLTEEESSKLWRIHFAEAELDLMKKREALKPVIKTVKCLRDKEEWPIPSYFIKTVAFWTVKEHPDPQYFHERYTGARFLEMLDRLQQCLENDCLGHIFFTTDNILKNHNNKSFTHVSNRIKKIIAELQQNPNSARALFRCPKSRRNSRFSKLPSSKRHKTSCSSAQVITL